MSHLDTERLAELADDEPTPAEAEHLTMCEECARERDAHRTVFALSSGYGAPVAVPLTDWDTLARGLRAEGLLYARGWRSWMRGPAVRAAAAVLLLLGGVVIGRASATRGSSPRAAAGVDSTRTPAAFATFASPADAQDMMLQAQQTYQLAAAYLQAHDTVSGGVGDGPDVYRSRLAALDAMADVAREAVNETPHDPVINRYYLTTLTAREATLRQLGQRLPDGESLGSF